MATLTVRMPDERVDRLKILAKTRGISLNKLIEEWATLAIAEFDSRSRFMARAARGSRERGLATLQRLNEMDGQISVHGLHDSGQSGFGHGAPVSNPNDD